MFVTKTRTHDENIKIPSVFDYQHNLYAIAPCSVLTHAVHGAFNKSYSDFDKTKERTESIKRIQDNETTLYKMFHFYEN